MTKSIRLYTYSYLYLLLEATGCCDADKFKRIDNMMSWILIDIYLFTVWRPCQAVFCISALVSQLEDETVLETVFCEFESHRVYYGLVVQRRRRQTVNPLHLKHRRFESCPAHL